MSAVETSDLYFRRKGDSLEWCVDHTLWDDEDDSRTETVVIMTLNAVQANDAVITWLRGPMGPVGPMGPMGLRG